MKNLGDIALLVEGALVGDSSIQISGVAALEDAKDGDLAFVLEIDKLLAAEASGASALIVPKEVASSKKSIIRVDHTRIALAKVLSHFAPVEDIKPGIDSSVYVGRNVKFGKRVLVYPFVFIGDNCEIGDDSIIHPNTTLYPRTKIGKRCVIHSGCVIGVDGFGFVQVAGKFVKVPQIGKVIIEDDVEIYANNCIARGAIGATTIKHGTKIDNLNHIAHNVSIGQDCGIAAQNVFGGSSSTGNRVQMSGQTAIAPHTHVGDDGILMARAGVTKNAPDKSVLLGYPAQDHSKELKIMALTRKLPELFDKVKNLEKEK
ncbi:MAG: UDP-3-O-(3-hydroxymyristoyl)glucosamine N-acyltransferase [Candidatus Margulisiibacteriota bacterium]